jgi:hypothetical protein
MRVTFASDQFAVLDDVLPADQAVALWRYLQAVPLNPINPGMPLSPWLPTDGKPLTSKTVAAWLDPQVSLPASQQACYPTGTAIDLLLRLLLSDPSLLARWAGQPGQEWVALTAAAWIYPVGTALSWHSDSALYSGAYTYYAHPSWDPHWGGELMLADPGAQQLRELIVDPHSKQPSLADDGLGRFDRSPLSQRVAEVGIGACVVPKPNRLVLIAGGHPHRVARVDVAAGQHVRASIAGFFLRKQALQTLGARASHA